MEQVAPDQWQELAQQLLQVRRPVQAEAVVRRHLSQHPHSGRWACRYCCCYSGRVA